MNWLHDIIRRLQPSSPAGKGAAQTDAGDAAIRDLLSRVHTLVEALPDAIVIVDRAGRIVFVNRMAESLFGYPPREILGQSVEILMPAAYARPHVSQRAEYHAAPNVRPMGGERREAWGRRKDGSEFPVEIHLGPLPSDEGLLVIATVRDSTAPRKLEAELRASERMQRSIAENVPHAYLGIVGRDLKVRFVSGQEMREQQLDPAAFVGLHVRDVFAPYGEEVVRTVLEAYERTFAGEEQGFELHINNQDQLYRAVPMREEGGTIDQILVVVENITARKQAEAALRASEARLRNILDSMFAFVAVFSREGILLDVNRAPLEASGLRAEDVLGRPFADSYWFGHDPASREAIRAAMQQAAAGQAVRQDSSVRLGPHTVIQVDGVIAPLRNSDGEIVELVGSAIDITERKRSEALVDGQKRVLEKLAAGAPLREILDTLLLFIEAQSPGMLCSIVLLEDGERIRHGSAPSLPAAYHESINGLPIGPDAGSCGAAAYRREPVIVEDINTSPLWEKHRQYAAPYGLRACWSTPILDARGEVLGTFAMYYREPRLPDAWHQRLIDVATHTAAIALARHRDEAALRESEERFRQVVENIQEVFWMTDGGGRRILYVSPNYDRVWGRSCESLYANHDEWLEAVHEEDRAGLLAATAHQATDGYDGEYRIVRPDGTIRWIHSRSFPVSNAEGVVYRIVGVAEDITARNQLESQLRQAQKMDVIGQFSGGLAHDFNNLLTVIAGHVSLLSFDPDLSEATQESIREIKEAADRAANLTRQLLTFSRQQAMQRRALDLNDLVRHMGRMLRPLLGEPVRLELQLASTAVSIVADAGMLEQVLMNLAVNARDAMPRGGVLLIRTEERGLQAGEADFACLTVSDTGEGIAPELVPRIFEPFFTTKPIGKGTGLGLATAYGIVQQHGGRIEVQSKPREGTTFRVWLPRRPRGVAVADLPAVNPGTLAKQGNETILLVEDERALRTLVGKVLQHTGYRVFEAANGPDAIALWERERADIDILVTDLVMPDGLSGFEVAEHILRAQPDLPVIYVSGYSPEIAGQREKLRPGENFFAKPFEIEILIAAIRRALDHAKKKR